MIRGQVSADGAAMIRLQILGPADASQTIDAVIDTGFSGYLCLARTFIDSLELPFRQTETYTLADNSNIELDVFRCNVMWDGRVRPAFALAADGAPLLGMSLLRGFRLGIAVIDGGEVKIESLEA